jgi:hypothetical protein
MIWIDALCIPHDALHRQKAILLMIEAYKKASAVIVPDVGLRSTELSLESSSAELITRLSTAVWTQRLGLCPSLFMQILSL